MLLYYSAIARSPERGTMIPKTRTMIGIAREAEEAAHTYGWDRPPLLGVALAYPGGVMTGPFPVQPFQIADGDHLLGLRTVADAIERVPSDRLVVDINAIGAAFAGLWYMTELWSAPDDTVIPLGLGIADTPNAKEARLMVLLDCGGHLYTAYRFRGQPAEADEGMLADGEAEDIATIVDSLRRIMLALGQTLPADAVDLAAVAKVRADA